MEAMQTTTTYRRPSAREERPMASIVSTTSCGFCGRAPEAPRKVVQDGRIVECCVGEAHDAHVAPNSNHAAFVARARRAGITGKW